jgi:hypothetical protein
MVGRSLKPHGVVLYAHHIIHFEVECLIKLSSQFPRIIQPGLSDCILKLATFRPRSQFSERITASPHFRPSC